VSWVRHVISAFSVFTINKLMCIKYFYFLFVIDRKAECMQNIIQNIIFRFIYNINYLSYVFSCQFYCTIKLEENNFRIKIEKGSKMKKN